MINRHVVAGLNNKIQNVYLLVVFLFHMQYIVYVTYAFYDYAKSLFCSYKQESHTFLLVQIYYLDPQKLSPSSFCKAIPVRFAFK